MISPGGSLSSLGVRHPSPLQCLVQRVKHMACLWGLFGLLVGVATLARPFSAVGVLAGMIAGMIVLVPLGVILGLAGGRPGPTLFGGVSGAGLGAVTGMLASPDGAAHTASVALIGGAVAGATLPLASSGALSLVRTSMLTAARFLSSSKSQVRKRKKRADA